MSLRAKREPGPVSLEILGRSSVRRVNRGKAKSFGRNSMASDIVATRLLCKAAICDCHQHFRAKPRLWPVFPAAALPMVKHWSEIRFALRVPWRQVLTAMVASTKCVAMAVKERYFTAKT
jgi:hypothetical protein